MPDARERAQRDLLVDLSERLIADVWDPLEMKVILSVALLGGGNPVSEAEILDWPPLRAGGRGDGSDRDADERLPAALHRAVAHGILVALRDDQQRLWYVVSTAETLRRSYGTQFEVVSADGLIPSKLTVDRPDIFGLYEQNIGVVTPIMADRLAEALRLYPEEWIRDAISEAVAYNRRNWRYIQRILENWTTEGRTDETNRRDHEEHLDSEKYLRGKYAALFRRR